MFLTMNNFRNLIFRYCDFHDIFFLINKEKCNNADKLKFSNKINIG